MSFDWCDEKPDFTARCLEYEDLCNGETICDDGYDEDYGCYLKNVVSKAVSFTSASLSVLFLNLWPHNLLY